MLNKPRRNVLVQTDSGMMIVSRFDFCDNFPGIGQNILNTGNLKNEELHLLYSLLDPVVEHPIILEIGANIGSLSVGLAEFIYPRNGTIYCIEPQRYLFQMLNGNLAINNIDNAYTFQCAVGSLCGTLTIPNIDYYKPASFGSVELHGKEQLEDFGQRITYSSLSETVRLITVDQFIKEHNISKIDFLKIDVEGMEFDVLTGAKNTLEKFKPILYIEWWKVNQDDLGNKLQELGYIVRATGSNFVGIPIEKQELYKPLLGIQNYEN